MAARGDRLPAGCHLRPRDADGRRQRRRGGGGARLLRRGVARRSPAARRLLDGRHGAAVLPAAGDPLVHVRQHRGRHLGQAGAGRGGEHERSKICGFKAQGAPHHPGFRTDH